jgi:16S rRNA (cytosine967-C5)-methyltransferase
MAPAPTARQVALDLLGAVLRRKRPLDDAIEYNPDMSSLSVRDRAFARLLVATCSPARPDRRPGHRLLEHPAGAPRRRQDILRLGISQLLFLRRRMPRWRPALTSPITAGFCRIRALSTPCCAA